ncbi:MAG: glycosyltransferase [Zoogloeaceae bacterium]|jgi:glycosyltransferase involved in cell wall biosynthesis|nr:glycosyltransferase [Zoogloeaceae bacterium]
MRVLMVSDVYFPRINGVSSSIETFKNTLEDCVIEVEIIVPRYGDEAEEEGVTRVQSRNLPFSLDPEDRRLSWRRMKQVVLERARDCDLIHIHTPFIAHYAGLRAARKRHLPALATYHTLFAEYFQHYIPFLPRRYLGNLARRFSSRQCNALDGVVVPSTAMLEQLKEYGVRVPLHVLPTGIPLERFTRGDREVFRRQFDIDARRPVALFVGRVAHEKNIGFLLRMWALALRQNPDLLLLLAGDGPALPDLQEEARRLGIDHAVRFLGYLDRNGSLLDCYAAADVFVFSSLTETQGMVLPEAMAAGLPVIALAKLGTRDILEAGKACIAPPTEEKAFADAVLRFFADAALRERLQAEAPETARDWSDVASTRRLAEIYRGMVA